MPVSSVKTAAPIPRCPPMDLLRERAYQAKLDKMSVPELKQEKQKLQNLLMTSRWSDPKARAWVERQVQMVNKELKSRDGLSPELKAYQKKLDKMTTGELFKEKAQIQRLMQLGRWTPEGYKLISKKLEMVVAEINTRGPKIPVTLDQVG